MTDAWDADAPGVLRLPSGRLIRGRALRRPMIEGPAPLFGLYLTWRRSPAVAWESRRLRWPDLLLPCDRREARAAFHQAWERAAAERVEVACRGGRGRTGTALACVAVLDGMTGTEAIAHVRASYSPHAVETPWQRRFVLGFE